ncbi:MAG: dihydrolipoyl dehydrogenase, partial [Candidatus Theseobacter exili]|nr:dihydrolipoyl dehydrogenase [Candidatus Theseobacter exili]
MSKNKTHDLVIIGAGPGGYRAAFMAADLGLNVTLIDPELNPGGVCLYRGCIPTKALLHLAKIKTDAEHAGDLGIKFSTPQIDIEKVIDWKNKVVKQLTGGLGQLVKARKINYIRGRAKFINSNTVELSGDNNGEKITFKNAIIATGAIPVRIPNINIDSEHVIDSTKALDLKEIPKKMLIIGAGYIGLEMATIYQALGSEVSVVELTKDFMPGMDTDLVAEYKKANKDLFKDVLLETIVEGIKEQGKQLEVSFKDKDDKSFKKKYDKVLVAIGQKPNSDNLGLENTNIEQDEKGFIKVNKKQQTSNENIFAIGDIAGQPLLAHKASYEGIVAVEVIAGKKAALNDAKVIPSVVYTEPEIASCGLSEKEAKEKNIDYKIVKFPWAASGRAVAMNEKNGFTKLLIDKENERLLGAGIVGRNAGDMISELVLAIEMAATAEDIARTIHPHPTLAETIMESAEMFYGHAAHV